MIVAIDEQHVALPKLYGAPAYARPAKVVAETPRPFDPDDLPIEAVRTEEERGLLATDPAHSSNGGTNGSNGDADHMLRPRPLSLRALAGRILGQGDN